MSKVTYLGESEVPMGDRQLWVADEAHQSRGKGSHCEGQIPWRPLGGTCQAAEGQRKLPVKARKESKQPLPEQPWKRSRVIKRAHTTEGRREAARGWERKREFS